MNEQGNDPVLLAIRGTLADGAQTESARKTHNATAGNPAGVAAARSLGDLSHKVYVPAKSELSGAKPDEFLILDVWETPAGIEKFFSDKDVQQGGAKLFKQRDPGVWMRARGAFGFSLQAPMNRPERHVGILRVQVKSPDAAIAAFRETLSPHVNQARQRGQLSHELFFRLAPPSAHGQAELLALDVWCNLEGMQQHYREVMEGLGKVFVGAPQASIWTQPVGEWVEW